MTSVPARMPAGDGGPPGLGVERGHRRDRLLRHLAGRLHPAVEDADAQRLGQRQRRPGDGGVVADDPVEVDQPRDGHAVLGLRVVDRVAAADVAAGLLGHLEPAAQHLGGQLGRQHVARPAEQVDGDDRGAAHRVDVGERVGRGDPAERVRVVDHGGEEVGREHQALTAGDADHRRVVAVVQADDELGVRGRRAGPRQAGHDGLQLAGRDLAGAAAAVRVLRESGGTREQRHGHESRSAPRHAWRRAHPSATRRHPRSCSASARRWVCPRRT